MVKQTDYDNIYKRPIDCAENKYFKFDTMPARGDFITNMKVMNPSDNRFQLKEDYDRSKYLTTTKPVVVHKFESHIKRDCEAIIKQGGDTSCVDVLMPGARSEHFYETQKKEKNFMERLDKKCIPFDGYERRNEIFSIYRRDFDMRKDPYDLDKVNRGTLKTTKGTGKSCFVEMKKQNDRNYKKLYQQSVGDAYANIQRENEKADYIKRLLMQA